MPHRTLKKRNRGTETEKCNRGTETEKKGNRSTETEKTKRKRYVKIVGTLRWASVLERDAPSALYNCPP